MARQNLNVGALANDGTGDSLRDANIKVNDNFTELYNVGGWGNYVDDATTPLSLTTTPLKVTINALASTTETGYLPREIRGVSDLWNTTTNKITPVNIGDAYDLRLDILVTAKSAATFIDMVLDIGGAATITVPIVDSVIALPKTPPFNISFSFPIFCLTTFFTNGGQIFLNTDTGTATVTTRGLFIKRDYSGLL